MSSSCLLWCLTSLSSCVISRHLKPRVLYKCMQHSSIIHCSSLPDSCRFFFPPPFCGSWPISSVRAPDSEWNITVLFGTAPPTHFLQMPARKKPFLLWCYKNGVSAAFYYLSKQNFDALCHYYEQLLKIHSLSEAYSYECIVKTFHMPALTYHAFVFLQRHHLQHPVWSGDHVTGVVFLSALPQRNPQKWDNIPAHHERTLVWNHTPPSWTSLITIIQICVAKRQWIQTQHWHQQTNPLDQVPARVFRKSRKKSKELKKR